MAANLRNSCKIRKIRRTARRIGRKLDTFQRIRKIRRWSHHGSKSSNLARRIRHSAQNSKISKVGRSQEQTRYIPKHSKNSKMGERWGQIFGFLEEFEDCRGAPAENAIHSKEFEKFEDGETMGANLRISRKFRKIRRFAPMVSPSSNFSNSLECIAFSAGDPRQSSNSSNSSRNPKICDHCLPIFEFFEFPGNPKIAAHGSSIFESSNSLESIAFSAGAVCHLRILRISLKFEDCCPWFLHIRIFEFFGIYRVFCR